jgi:hypothetical protein
LVTMTQCSASTSAAAPPDGHHQEHHNIGPGRDRRAGLPHPSIEGPTLRDSIAQLAEGHEWRTGPTRNTWRHVCNAKSPPASPTAAKDASAQDASRPESRWRTVTSPGAEEDDIVAGGDEVQGSQVGDGVAFQAAGVAISGRVEFELPPHRVPVLVLHTAALVAVLRFRRNSAAFFASKDL